MPVKDEKLKFGVKELLNQRVLHKGVESEGTMKKWKKKYGLIVMAALCFGLAACGGAEEAVETEVQATEAVESDARGEESGFSQAETTLSPVDDPNEGLGGDLLTEDTVNDFSGFAGIWLGEANNEYDYMEIDAEGNWWLYLAGEIVDDGYLRYEPEWEAIYAYSNRDDSGSRIMMEDGQLYSAAHGYFNPGEGMEYLWYQGGGRLTEDDEPAQGGGHLTEDDEPAQDEVPAWNGRLEGNTDRHSDGYWSWDSDLCQRNVSEFKGIWYYEGDLAAETYIVIDGQGNWSYYQRAPGAEAAEMDHGFLGYSTSETSTYYADSTQYEGVSYRVFEFDEDALVWGDEGVYYLMEK